ncbi:MAG: hypothetical protein OXT74_12900 [Candidatus Poribacteria bacterium]|nr:hypothetical protein [Candidatus Poribacteria bacterium]
MSKITCIGDPDRKAKMLETGLSLFRSHEPFEVPFKPGVEACLMFHPPERDDRDYDYIQQDEYEAVVAAAKQVGDTGFATDHATLLGVSDPRSSFASFRLTLIHELQHAANDLNNKMPKGTPSMPPWDTPRDQYDRWRDEYSAYSTELAVANELGTLNTTYHQASVSKTAAKNPKKAHHAAVRAANRSVR